MLFLSSILFRLPVVQVINCRSKEQNAAMSACDTPKADTMKDNVSRNSVDEGLPRELSSISIASGNIQDDVFCARGHPQHTLKNIFGYYQTKKLCDVVLIAGGTR